MGTTHTWWYLSRGAGLVAWGAAGAAIVCGILLGTRLLGKRPGSPYLTALHRHLALITLLATALHMGALVGDSYTHFTLSDLLVPGSSAWKPAAVAWGVVAFWLLLAVQVTSWAMRRLPRRIWFVVHCGSYLLFAFVTVHAFTAGTDLQTTAARAGAATACGAVFFVTVYRLVGPSRSRVLADGRAARAARATAPAVDEHPSMSTR